MTTIPIYSLVDESWFDHIKIDHTNWDGRCPLEDDIKEINNESVIDLDSEHMSWLLSQILDRPNLAATKEIVRNRRAVIRMRAYAYNLSSELSVKFIGGSIGDGFSMKGGDVDTMITMTDVIVTYPDYHHTLPEDIRHKTVLYMRETDCQPGYVTLELRRLRRRCPLLLSYAIVPIGDSEFISSDIFRRGCMEQCGGQVPGLDYISNGPCTTVTQEDLNLFDFAYSIHCPCWPKEADEWVYRTRLYGWPTQELRDKVVQSGCHLVPVGDRCSSDTFLQWRISFLTAERRLVHSLSHQQFRIYGLLKYFLKQIKDLLENIIGDGDILCSYFIKTLIFHAVEHSPSTLWQDKNALFCFRFCLSILIGWIKNGNCPNYFIKDNNLFKRKIHGEIQQKLLHFLTDMYNIKWASLSVGTCYRPSIAKIIYQAVFGQLSDILPSTGRRECDRDIDVFVRSTDPAKVNMDSASLSPLRLLSESQSDTDEFIAYDVTATTLRNTACTAFIDRTPPGGNKQKYKGLRKCKRLLTPGAAMCRSPGLLHLATFHYHTGNYRQSLEMCGEVISYPRLYIGYGTTFKDSDRYQHQYCGRGYSLYHKLRAGCVREVSIYKKHVEFGLPHLHLELTKHPWCLLIPPLPYAVFLSFLCYHDLGNTSRQDAALLHLRDMSSDPGQGHRRWIVHTLLGICYQTVGDNRRAIQAYTESLHLQTLWNPAMDRIAVVYLIMCYQALSIDTGKYIG